MDFVEHEIRLQPSIRVTPIDTDEYHGLLDKYPQAKVIAMKSWEILEPNEVVVNDGAAPCSITWIYDKSKNQMIISGHFLSVNKDSHSNFIANQIGHNKVEEKPITSNELLKTNLSHNWHLSRKEISQGYEEFISMTREISKLTKEYGGNNYEVYLFGQNFAQVLDKQKTMQNLVNNTIEQNSLTVGLYRAGILPTDIHDYRSTRHHGGDDTIYVPQEKTIYHVHSEN